MCFLRKKKGIDLEFGTLVNIILLIAGFGLLIGVILSMTSKAEQSTQELLCRGFNAVKFGYEKNAGSIVKKVISPPRACNTFDKGILPSKDFKSRQDLSTNSERAKVEVRDLMKRCWWMWLEGRQQNMFDKGIYQNDGCFVCYTFFIDNKADFTTNELITSLYEPYFAKDSSNHCAGGGVSGGGGRSGGGGAGSSFGIGTPASPSGVETAIREQCMTSCRGDFPNKVFSTACPQNQVCCVNKKQDECQEKGGTCSANPPSGYKPYLDWKCSGGNTCYVSQDNFASYLDYLQGTRGAGYGPGMVVYEEGMSFSPNQLYAVTMLSPSRTWNWAGTGAGGLGALAITAAAISGFYTGGIGFLFAAKLAAAGLATGAATAEFSGDPRNFNYILVSRYASISSKCSIEKSAAT